MNPTKITRNGKFALVGDHVFTIVQGDLEVFKVMPRPIDMPKPAKDWSVDGIWTIGWPWDELPFMPLVPVHRSFSGPLFRRLSYDYINARGFALKFSSLGLANAIRLRVPLLQTLPRSHCCTAGEGRVYPDDGSCVIRSNAHA